MVFLSLVLIMVLPGVSGIMGNMKDDRLGPENPFHVYYTDPEYFNDMELDALNRTLYLATDYGVFVKDLETGEFCNMGMWFGLEDSRITQIHLDLNTGRLFAVDERNPFIYVIDTESLELLYKFVIKKENGAPVETDIDRFTYDGDNDRIFASSSEVLFIINLNSKTCEMIDSSEFFDPGSGIDDWYHVQEMKYVKETGLLYLATLRGFLIYNPDNGTAGRIPDCEVLTVQTHGMDLDERTGNLYIAGYRLVKFNIYTEEWMQYPYVYDDWRNDTFIPVDEFPEEEWDDGYPLFRVCYDPLRDEVYCQMVTYLNLLRFDGSKPRLLRTYHYEDYQGESFAQGTTCRIIFDPVTDDILFCHGRFKTGGSSSGMSWDSETRIMWYHVDEDSFENIEIFRKNPGEPDHWNEFYWLRTTPLHDGLVVGNHYSLFLLDDRMDIIRDYSDQIEQVFDMEFRGPDLYISAKNGTFILNFNNNSLSRIGINDSVNFYGVEIPSENGPVYLGSAYGVHIYYPENKTLRFFNPINNRTNPEEGNFTNFGRLAPGGIYVHPKEEVVYLYTDQYSDLLELDLNTGKYTYLNNLTVMEDGESINIWNDERVSKVLYSEEMDDIIILTHHGLRNGTYGDDPRLPQTACLNSIYLDEEEDILYAITGEFLMYEDTGPSPSWPSGSPQGFFIINLRNGSFENILNRDGMPWIWNKGFHHDEVRDRLYFAGGRSFYWIDMEDLEEVYQREEVPHTNITLLSDEGRNLIEEENSEIDKETRTSVILIIIVSILILILIIANVRMGKKGPDLRDNIQIKVMNR